MKKLLLLVFAVGVRVSADDAYGETVVATDQPAAVAFRKCANETRIGDEAKVGRLGVCSTWDPAKTFGSMAVHVANLGTEVGFVYSGGAPIAVLPGKSVVVKAVSQYGLKGVVVAADKGKQTRLHVFASNPIQVEP